MHSVEREIPELMIMDKLYINVNTDIFRIYLVGGLVGTV